MKEIDFLPGWYKNNRRQQITYRAQYVALGGIFVLMLVSNFVTSRSISRAEAQHANIQLMETDAKKASIEYGKITSEIATMKKRADILKQIDSRVNVGDVLAELSFLVGRRIVLTKVELTAEKSQNPQTSNTGTGFAVRPAGVNSSGKEELLVGDVKFKVVVGGIAAGASDAEFVSRLEDSPYFCSVYPAFTRNKQIKVGAATAVQSQSAGRISREHEEGIQVNEFEIGCYLANFTEK